MYDNQQQMLHTIAETAKILHVNISYVHRLRRAGLLPAIKLGCYKVRDDALREFLRRYEGWDLTDPENPVQINGGAV